MATPILATLPSSVPGLWSRVWLALQGAKAEVASRGNRHGLAGRIGD